MTEDRVWFLPTDVDLSVVGLNHAGGLHHQHTGVWPTTLLVHPKHCYLAYELLSHKHGVIGYHPVVVTVPNFPGWAVCSGEGMVISGIF